MHTKGKAFQTGMVTAKKKKIVKSLCESVRTEAKIKKKITEKPASTVQTPLRVSMLKS